MYEKYDVVFWRVTFFFYWYSSSRAKPYIRVINRLHGTSFRIALLIHGFVLVHAYQTVRCSTAGCFTFVVFWISCRCYCSLTLPHSAVGWSEVCDSGISWSYLAFFLIVSGIFFAIFGRGSRAFQIGKISTANP